MQSCVAQPSSNSAGTNGTIHGGRHSSLNVRDRGRWVTLRVLDNLQVLTLRGSCRSPGSFMSLVRAFLYPLPPTACYGNIRTTGMARNTSKRPPRFPEPHDATPLELFQLLEWPSKSFFRHISLAKDGTNTIARITMESTHTTGRPYIDSQVRR